MQSRYWHDSITLFEHALAINRASAPAYNSLAAQLVDLRRPAAAIPLATKSTQLRPELPNGYATLGAALVQEGRSEEAAEAYRRAARPGTMASPLPIWQACSRRPGTSTRPFPLPAARWHCSRIFPTPTSTTARCSCSGVTWRGRSTNWKSR